MSNQHYGVIFCGFNCADTLESALSPWIQAREQRLGGNKISICAVSVPFIGFGDCRAHDNTHFLLNQFWSRYEIDHVISHETPMKETAARGEALKWLVERGVDATFLVDADEFYTIDEISRIFAFAESHPQIAAFRGSLKNYVEASGQRAYLTEPFTPLRLHRVRYGTYVADSFYDDNGVLYRGTITRDFKRDIDLPVLTIPRNVAWTRHESWGNNERSRKKIAYQLEGRRWPSCSFAWDDEQGGLIFNPALPIPETAQDE